MAFSMFMRTPACANRNRMLAQQIMKIMTQPSLSHQTVASALPTTSHLFKDSRDLTPITNAVRSLRTSTVNPATAKVYGGHGDEKAHDHSKLWVIEKGVTMAMVPLVPLALLIPNKLFDIILAILITAHSFWGLEAIAVDYVRASIVGTIIPKITLALVYIISFATLGGLFYLITHDVGLGNAVKQLWSVQANKDN